MKDYQREVGQLVLWFRFNEAATTAHPIYDTGPQRQWYPPVLVPAYISEYLRARKNFDDDGLYFVDHLHMIFSYDAFFRTGMPDPDPNGQNHLNDRVAFDGRLFSVSAFFPQGRVADRFLTISVDVNQVKQEEMDEDVEFTMFAPYWNLPGPGSE